MPKNPNLATKFFHWQREAEPAMKLWYLGLMRWSNLAGRESLALV